MGPTAPPGYRLKGKVHGNTTRPIVEAPHMAIGTSRTASGKVTIVFPEARVIGHGSQQQRARPINWLKVIGHGKEPPEMPAIKQLEVTGRDRRLAALVRTRDHRMLALRAA